MIRFILNDRTISVPLQDSAKATLDFIRKERKLKGMKLVCKEGECGACTVLVGDFESGRLVYRSMTSCIMPLANAHGKHLLTIEGLDMEGLTKVQRAMIDQSGTQCGFCTPGFVVSMTGALLTGEEVSMKNMVKAIDGNICRCTGYKSILRACESVADDWNDSVPSIEQLVEAGYLPDYFNTIPAKLEKIKNQSLQSNGLKRAEGIKLGGGTDLYVQKPRQMYTSAPDHMFDKPELNHIELNGNVLSFGASVTMGDLYRSAVFNDALPGNEEFFKLLSSSQIRNMATIGGNLVNASPIGDFTIFLLGLNADIELTDGKSTRRLPLREFYLDYKKMNMRDGEHLTNILIEIPDFSSSYFNFEKVSQRKYLDIASVNSAALIQLQNDKIAECHISIGGVGPTPKYLNKTRDFLLGKILDGNTLTKALDVLQSEISPISDPRGSADYKRLLARQLFLAHCLKINSEILDVSSLITPA